MFNIFTSSSFNIRICSFTCRGVTAPFPIDFVLMHLYYVNHKTLFDVGRSDTKFDVGRSESNSHTERITQ